MNIPTFLGLATQEEYCDECIAASLRQSPEQVEQVTSALANQEEFAREKGECAMCYENVLVTCAVERVHR
jgi:hypothetical protein